MNKREFLDLLRYYLRSYPANIINDMVADYEEHFRIGIENGKSEEDIAKELGSPKDIAEEFYQHELPPKPSGQQSFSGAPNGTVNPTSSMPNNGPMPRNMPKTKPNFSIWLILLAIVGLVVIFPPVFGIAISVLVVFVAILVSLFAVVLALGLSGVAALVGWAFPVYNLVTFYGATLHPVTSVFLGLFLVCLAILICYLTISLITLCIKAFKNLYLSIRWSIAKRRNN